jgi:hypothetical protein
MRQTLGIVKHDNTVAHCQAAEVAPCQARPGSVVCILGRIVAQEEHVEVGEGMEIPGGLFYA